MITPFGLVGKLATKGFQRRLREHYYPSKTYNEGHVHETTQEQETINMNRFLLDYVLDMGPASAPKPKPEVQSTVSLSSAEELSRVSQNQRMLNKDSDSAAV